MRAVRFHWIFCLGLGVLLAACGRGRPEAVEVTPVPTIAATDRQLRVFEAAWTAVRDQYVREDLNGLDWEALGEQYRAEISAGLSEEEFAANMRALLANLPDNQATYQTRAERLEQETADRRTYHGIGAFISFREEPEPHVVVLAVIEDSPAERAGLQPHDTIWAIDGGPFTLDDAPVPAARIRGEPNSTVVLTVQTPGGPRREMTIQREQIRAADVLRGGFLESLGVAYYRVPVSAESDLANTIAQSLVSIGENEPPRGVIIDLRVARQGDGAWPLQEMLSLFGDGQMGEFYSRQGTNPLTIAGQNLGGSQTVPLVVLVGLDTEGSPEIFAASLQSSGRAVLMGMPTSGAVEGYSEVPLPDGSRVFLATTSFRTQANLDLAESGLVPDVEIDADWGEITNEDDPILEAALSALLSE